MYNTTEIQTYTMVRFAITCKDTGKTATIEALEGPRLWKDVYALAKVTAKREGIKHYSFCKSFDKVRTTKVLY